MVLTNRLSVYGCKWVHISSISTYTLWQVNTNQCKAPSCELINHCVALVLIDTVDTLHTFLEIHELCMCTQRTLKNSDNSKETTDVNWATSATILKYRMEEGRVVKNSFDYFPELFKGQCYFWADVITNPVFLSVLNNTQTGMHGRGSLWLFGHTFLWITSQRLRPTEVTALGALSLTTCTSKSASGSETHSSMKITNAELKGTVPHFGNYGYLLHIRGRSSPYSYVH